jgi:hypothetical protein
MILTERKDLPLTAPECNDLFPVLEKFRAFKDNEVMQINDLIEFLLTPTAEREKFFNLLDKDFVVEAGKSVKQILS